MSTSAFLNAQYPWQTGGRVEPHPLVRDRLSKLGHSMRMFSHPGARARNIRGKVVRASDRLFYGPRSPLLGD